MLEFFKKLVSKLSEQTAIIIKIIACREVLGNATKVSVFERNKNVWKNGKNMTLLIGILCKCLNKGFGREETTLHRLYALKKKSTNHYMKGNLPF